MDRVVCTSFPVGDDLDAVISSCCHGASPQRTRAIRSRLQVLVQRSSNQQPFNKTKQNEKGQVNLSSKYGRRGITAESAFYFTSACIRPSNSNKRGMSESLHTRKYAAPKDCHRQSLSAGCVHVRTKHTQRHAAFILIPADHEIMHFPSQTHKNKTVGLGLLYVMSCNSSPPKQQPQWRNQLAPSLSGIVAAFNCPICHDQRKR